MGKARVGFYATKGETLARTHTFCPQCGPGVFLAIHPAPHPRRTCGKCGYAEAEKATAPVPAPRAPRGKGAPKGEKPAP